MHRYCKCYEYWFLGKKKVLLEPKTLFLGNPSETNLYLNRCNIIIVSINKNMRLNLLYVTLHFINLWTLSIAISLWWPQDPLWMWIYETLFSPPGWVFIYLLVMWFFPHMHSFYAAGSIKYLQTATDNGWSMDLHLADKWLSVGWNCQCICLLYGQQGKSLFRRYLGWDTYYIVYIYSCLQRNGIISHYWHK